MITHSFSLILKVLFNAKVKETHGMKAFRRRRVKPIITKTRLAKDLFDTEFIIRAERQGLRIKEVPTTIEEQRPTRTSILTRIPRTAIGLLALRYLLWKERLLRN
jgi:hypothetical protein